MPKETADMSLADESPFARKLGAFVALQGDDFRTLDRLHCRRRSFAKGRDMVLQGRENQHAYILASGWVCSYKLLPSGKRQIINFQIPGDFLGLRLVLSSMALHNIAPVTRVEATVVLVSDLQGIFRQTPRLATAVFMAASRDEAIVEEHLVDVGRRDAKERTAHFLLELSARLQLVGLGTALGYSCPLSQYMLADALALSPIHVNRVLRQLREDGLVTFRNGEVEIHDLDRLVALADFDKTYLDQVGPQLS